MCHASFVPQFNSTIPSSNPNSRQRIRHPRIEPHRSGSKSHVNSSSFRFLAGTLCISLIFCQTRPSYGGTCWLNVNKNGKCSALVEMGISKSDCCGNGILAKSATAAFSEGEMSSSSIFIMHIQGGVQCSRCKDSCEDVKCPPKKKCVVRNGHPKCICSPNCTAYRLQNGIQQSRGPVCGTDGQTYKNTCRLLKRSCRQKRLISIAYAGRCKASCSDLKCPGSKKCLLDMNLIPHCVNCSGRKCSHPRSRGSRHQICGVDELTYPSVCHLRQTACQKGKAIPIAYLGPCKKKATCETIQCSAGQSCLVGKPNGKPRCVACSRKRWCKKYQRYQVTGPVCANNGKTYKNWCEMMDEACFTGYSYDVQHLGQCKRKDRGRNRLGSEFKQGSKA